jgi:2-methylcitrate dehydratase PrpD
VLAAFIIGFQVSTRLAWGLTPGLYRRGWQPNGPLGAPGVAAAASRLLALNAERTQAAIGIAIAQLAGARGNFPSMTKALHIGHSARAGVYGAMLAQRGFTAYPNMVEGSGEDEGHERYGMAETYVGRGNYKLDKMVLKLNEEWELAQNRTFPRMYPCGTTAAPVIDAMIDLAVAHDLKADQVERIELEMTPQALGSNSLGATNSYDARFCMPYTVSVALIDRKAGLAQYTDERVARSDVQTLLKRVKVWIPDDFKRHLGRWGEDGVNPGLMRLAVFLKDGRVLREARSHARGWPEEPVTWKDMVNKCAECAEGAIAPERRDQAIALVHDLDRLPKVADLMNVLRTST